LHKDKNQKKDSVNRFNTVVLAKSRGGVVTGDVIASALGLNLDIIISRKIGAPDNPELAFGAVMHDGRFYVNSDIINILQIPDEYVKESLAISDERNSTTSLVVQAFTRIHPK
jgi:predicted phosphoribosyltransferase